ncbi:MAG: FecR domain-containing protein [Deltaproteobacteria bacterium]|nr:FecR domain-containing protein [Deltaproteobacteria bacterium]
MEPRTASDLDEGLEGVYARMDEARARRRGLVRWSLLGATATLCALVGLKVASDFRERLPAAKPPALAYVIEGGSVLEGGYLRESGLAGVKLSFNEGSRVVLLPGTRGRLRAVDKEGARVGIEHGTASFHVTQGGGRRWSVEAGPFLVTVKGTVFWLSWDSSSERFDLRLRHGRVVVSGPISGGDIALRAGQRLVVSLPRAETLITEEGPEAIPEATIDKPAGAPAVRPPALRPPVVSNKPAGPKPSAAPAPSAVARIEGERRWADELASGHWDRILDEVERTGVESALDKTSSEDLFALANAARYRRRTDLARAALLAQRRRFPGSPRALDSIFLLGRVEEARARGMDRAIAWYDEYLTRAPTGAYAAEALGRKMTLTSEIGGPEKARPIAEEYLRRFPEGSYAGTARALRRVP